MPPVHVKLVRLQSINNWQQRKIANLLLLSWKVLVGLVSQAKAFMSELVRQSKEHSPPSVTNFRDFAHRAISVCLLNGNCFVLHNGCLRLREWDGKYRRDRRRQASRSRYPVVRSYAPARLPSTEESVFEVIVPTSNLQVEVQNPNLTNSKWNFR